ncbi:LysR family transcriptional regulator [Aeoliella mucimassa]|uniref:Hydrogen peroxide-inducible genes activator n=1 Tax=Aeoliella mucimassa TaxID=2527972 RepID=A0A518APW1_9BACT|nr:LysR family transcriptional regulator [Aeoliella mucimassa]QDU56751.1 Hydrogen peroxide-inducible genes activator [Aeoliella mucimassa]
MDIEQLKQFLQVARLGNITRAAEELAISQPTLSRSIQRLEEEFGQPLLERKTRAVALTDAGVLLKSRAEQIIGILDDTKAEMTDDGRSGRLRIGAIPTIAPYFLPDFLRYFREQFAEAVMIVQEETTDNLLASCKQGEVDLAILALPIAAKYVDTEALFDEELLLTMPVGHPLATKKRVVVDDVEPYPFVLLGEAHCLTSSVVSSCRQRSFQPVAVERTSQLATVQELVSLGHGVSMIPKMAHRCDASKTRVYRSFDGAKPKRTVAMAWNPYRFESRLLLALRDKLREYCSEHYSA